MQKTATLVAVRILIERKEDSAGSGFRSRSPGGRGSALLPGLSDEGSLLLLQGCPGPRGLPLLKGLVEGVGCVGKARVVDERWYLGDAVAVVVGGGWKLATRRWRGKADGDSMASWNVASGRGRKGEEE